MAENIPQLPFANEREPAPSQPSQKFTAENIRGRMNAINSYLNTNRPAVLSGITQGQADQAALIGQYKDYMGTGTSQVPKVQNLISGNAMTGPNPGLKGLDLPTIDYVDALMNKSKIDISTKSDPYFFARPTSFNASKYGLNYDRYYSHPKFNETGFSIYRDNEALYNEKSSGLDDFRRMGSKWVGLAWQGGSSLFKNWGQFGAFGEAQDAAQMENDLSVAMSSKGGAGAWTTNFLANSAYTVGIIGEIAAEEAVLWGAAALTGGAASPLAALRTGQNLNRLGKSMKIMAETLNKADKAKSFWTGAKGAVNATGKFLNPISGTSDVIRDAFNVNSAYNRLDDVAKISKSFGAFYRDMREINAVTGESRLEGGFVQNKVANDSLAAFIKENNRMPDVNEAKVISDNAFRAGRATMIGNVPAIYLSNKVVLGTALKGFKPIRRLMNEEALSSSLFKTVSNYGWKTSGKKAMEVVQKGMYNSAKRTFSKEFLKSIPSKVKGTFSTKGAASAIGGGLRYFSANLMEGVQESYQEALQSGMSDYYMTNYFSDLYKDPHIAAKNSMLGSFMKGVDQQFSLQGLDVFAQGFLMGGVIGGAQNILMPAFQRATMKATDLAKGTNTYEEYVKSEKERLQKYADAVNSYTENPSLYAHWLDENTVLQRDLAERYQRAEDTGDREEAENVKDDSLFTHVNTLLQAGKFDGFIDQLEGMRDMSDQDLKDAFETGDEKTDQNKKSPRERLQTAIDKANNVKERFDSINEKFKNPYNPDLFDKVKNKEAYDAEHNGYTAFEIAKRSIAFNEYTFGRTLDRLTSLVNNAAANNPLGNVAASDFSALYTSDTAYMRHVETLSSEIDALKLGSAQDKTLAKKKATQLENLGALRETMQEFKFNLLLIEKAKLKEGDTENGTPVNIEDLKVIKDLLKDKAREFAKKMNIVGEGPVDEETGQISIDYEQEGIDDDVIINEYMKDLLYKQYAKYTKNIADLNNVFSISEGIENSFADLVDYMKLDAQAKHMSEYADIIANPMSIYNMTARVKSALEKVNTRRKELHLEALVDYKENILDVNDLLQKLFGIGVYFDPDSIKAFRKQGKFPDIFLSATDGSIIDKNNPKYKEIVDLIKEEELLRGKTFSNKPVAPPTPPPAPAPSATPGSSPQPPPPDEEDLEETPPVVFDITTKFSDFPKEMQDKLRAAHANAILSGATSDITEWIKGSPEAVQIISGIAVAGKPPVAPLSGTDTSNLISAANPKSIAGPTPDLQPIYDALERNGWTLSEDNTKYVSKDGREAFRVSDLKEGKPEMTAAMKAAANRGNILDIILREFAQPIIGPEKLSVKDIIINNRINNISDNASKMQIKLFLETQFKNKLAEKYGFTADSGFVDNLTNVLFDLAIRFKDYTWHTSLPTMVGTLVGKTYGGTIDLMLEKNGKYYIVDLKTSSKSRRLREELYDKNDQIQQNAYAELFEQLTGKPISGISILNMIVTTSSDSKTLLAVALDTFKNAEGKQSVLNALPRTSVADLKGYKPETPEETPAVPPTPPAPVVPTADKKADIERTLYGTLSGSIPLSQALPNGVYIDLGNGLFAYADKNDKIAAIVDRTNGYVVSKSFWNEKQNKWQLPNQANLKDDAKKLGVDEATYIKKYQDAVDSLNKAELAALGKTATPVSDIEAKKQKIVELRAKEQVEYSAMPDANNAVEKQKIYDRYDKLLTPLLNEVKADIKARREADLEFIGTKGGNYVRQKFGNPEGASDNKYFDSIRKVVNAQYDAELAALDQPSTVSEELTLPIQNGTITIARPYTGTYAEYWDFKVENGKLVSGTHRTYFEGEYRDTNTSNPITNLEEVYREKSAVERYKITSEETTPKVDWNAVIDRAASVQEVDKIMDQIYAANASTPELLDKALVKKQSFKPVKVKAPSRFVGKVIWAQIGTVNPEVFEKYDVVDANDIVEDVARKRGISPNERQTIHQTIQNLPANTRSDVQNQVKDEIQKLKEEGKTIITSNYYMKDSPLVDITSMPAEKEGLYMSDATSSEDSVRKFGEYLKENQFRTDAYTASQQRDWASQQLSNGILIEKNTNATVQQMFGRGSVVSTPLRSITNAGNPEYLRDSIAAYISNPEIRDKFTREDSNGVKTIVGPEEVMEMVKKRAEKLMQGPELDIFMQEITNMMAKQSANTEPTVSQEDKSSAQDAIKDATSASDTSATTAADIYTGAINKSNKEVDNDFDNSLGCK
jgi:hypothetical protein